MADFKKVFIQTAPIDIVDEGLEQCLDIWQQKGHAQAIMFSDWTWDPGIAGRTVHLYPGHGNPAPYNIQGGRFGPVHPEYWKGTILPPFSAPDPETAGRDFLAELLPAAQKRGMPVHVWVSENQQAHMPVLIPNFPKVAEEDVFGIKRPVACYNNPDYVNWHTSAMEDIVKSYPVAGVIYCLERRGPILNVVGQSRGNASPTPTCFCQHCRAAARERGINVERARAGYLALYDFVLKARGNEPKPADGYFVTFLRLLLKYPEIMAWEAMYTDHMKDFMKAIYGTVKAINPELLVGEHLYHTLSFSPLLRAEFDYSDIAHYADWVKVVIYDNPAGVRFAGHVRNLAASIFKDVPAEELVNVMYDWLQIEEAPLDELPMAGFSPDYVYREIKRAVAGFAGKSVVYAGVGINIPSPGGKQSSPDDVKAVVRAAMRAGAYGIVLSRKYSEIRLENLEAAGEALGELGM